jgi:hypothetical protein
VHVCPKLSKLTAGTRITENSSLSLLTDCTNSERDLRSAYASKADDSNLLAFLVDKQCLPQLLQFIVLANKAPVLREGEIVG